MTHRSFPKAGESLSTRRLFPRLDRSWRTVLAALLLVLTGTAFAQAFPTKPVRLITIQSPGSAVDIVARVLAQELGTMWGQSVVVENRVGASGLIAAEAAAKAAPDGYTLFMSTSGVMSLNPHLYPQLPYDSLRDFHALAHVANYPYLLLANENAPFRSVDQLVRHAKAQPKQVTYGSVGPGSLSNIAARLLSEHAGIELTHVFYKAVGNALTDVASGQIHLFFDTPGSAMPQIKAGRVRTLAVTESKRLDAFPDVPTMEELGYKPFQVNNWIGIYQPIGTPRELASRIASDIVKAVNSGAVKERLSAVSMTPVPMGFEEFSAFHRAEYEKWGRVLKELKIKLQE